MCRVHLSALRHSTVADRRSTPAQFPRLSFAFLLLLLPFSLATTVMITPCPGLPSVGAPWHPPHDFARVSLLSRGCVEIGVPHPGRTRVHLRVIGGRAARHGRQLRPHTGGGRFFTLFFEAWCDKTRGVSHQYPALAHGESVGESLRLVMSVLLLAPSLSNHSVEDRVVGGKCDGSRHRRHLFPESLGPCERSSLFVHNTHCLSHYAVPTCQAAIARSLFARPGFLERTEHQESIVVIQIKSPRGRYGK